MLVARCHLFVQVNARVLAVEDAASLVERHMCVVPVGGVVEILVSDPGAAATLLEWALSAGLGVLGSCPDETGHRVYLTRQS